MFLSPHFGQIGLNLIQIVQTEFNLCKHNENGSMWFKMDHIGLNLIKIEQTCLNLFRLDQIGSKLLNVVQNGSN